MQYTNARDMGDLDAEYWITVISYNYGGFKHLKVVPGDKIIALKQNEVKNYIEF